MENSNLRGSVDEEIVMKTGKVAGIGLAAGSVWGALVSMLPDGPQVGSKVKYPQLIRTGKVCGHYAASFAVIGATYVGVEQALEKYRMKDIFNGVAAGFATGAVMGFRVGSSRTAFLSGSAIALTSLLLDVTGMRTTYEEEKGHH
ncbi:outer envelope pore protein 16-3, chloroplastic/mitochondrial [Panicum miliaceum]|uniref:Outer envelope pore protein 16-3, chloroplastic/mitochondrial n=1 Tax=Panicum miliaceum TaxID=4540 RepID=A0A3L6QRR4_PANMI|nr:outer envelope pore protein 16-3, chloroplastic/mitochondrial [Panicum miliaceum]